MTKRDFEMKFLIEAINDYFGVDAAYFEVDAAELADHLLANGVIVPPCKLGDTVYCIRYDKARNPFIKPLEVLSITSFHTGDFAIFTTRQDMLGKTVFLTREEAEKALAEKESEE